MLNNRYCGYWNRKNAVVMSLVTLCFACTCIYFCRRLQRTAVEKAGNSTTVTRLGCCPGWRQNADENGCMHSKAFVYYLRQRGYVLSGVCLSVCPSVCLLATSPKKYWSTLQENFTIMCHWTKNSSLSFGIHPNPDSGRRQEGWAKVRTFGKQP